MLLLAVAVAEIHHQMFWQVELGQRFAGRRNILGMVIGLLSAAHNDMPVRVTAGLVDGHMTALIRRQEHVAGTGSADGINHDTGVAIGPVFEADRA